LGQQHDASKHWYNTINNNTFYISTVGPCGSASGMLGSVLSLEMISIMSALHVRLLEKQQAHFAGICGYPTSSQQQAARLLVQLQRKTISITSWSKNKTLIETQGNNGWYN
jgi:hypothetical protein